MNQIATRHRAGLMGPGHVKKLGLTTGGLYGLQLSNNVTDANNDIDILSGEARSIEGDADLILSATLTKRLDAAWAVGTGNGGLDTGSKASDTGYHVWLIRRPDTGVVDALFSTSATSPSMPANYTQKRRLGAVLTDSSGNIRAFVQAGGWFSLKTPFVAIAGSTANNLGVIRTINVPLGVKLRLRMAFTFNSTTNTCFFGAKDPDEGAPTIADYVAFSPAAAQNEAVGLEVFCNASGQIYTYTHRTDGVLVSTYLKGWYDIRDTSV